MSNIKLEHQRKIEIPYGQGDEVLELEVSNLPTPQETVGILQDQDCKIQLWIQLALEYYRQGKHDAFEFLLRTCLDRWDEMRVKRESATHPDSYKDRIRALDLLANFYVRKGNQTKNRDGKRDYFARAAQKFTEVDKSEFINKHGPEFQYHLVGRAFCCLMEGRSDQADSQFGFVLQQQAENNEPENVPSLLGRACIEFNKKEASGKRAALALYKKALQVCPNCPADVRLGLGICFYRLNMVEKAEAAFARAVALDQKCVGALAGLAIIELNRKTAYSIKKGTEYLVKAFKIEPNNSLVLTLLADHFFYANEPEKAIKSALRAQENTEMEVLQAQACYQLGRAYHRQKEYDKAFEFYYKATTFGGPQSFLAHYGVGQMYIHKKEYDAAITSFETVLKTNPDNRETLKVLASLYTKTNTKKDLARTYLKKVTESHPDDVDAWVELASLCEQTDTQTALSAYRTSIKLFEAQSKKVPAEIYNNVAALLFSTEALDESEEFYNLALKRCHEEMPNDRMHYGSIIYTIKYNIGRLHEAKHQLDKAENIYKEILVAHPVYIDCFLRLGCIERDRGHYYNASDRFKETFRCSGDNLDAWTLIANLHFYKQELGPCQKKFERILDKTKQAMPDLYSLIAVGNIYLQYLYMIAKNKEKLSQNRLRALQFYRAALKHDPKNIYAANGIGCIFASKAMYSEARDIFSQVREATADFPDVWINIAHIYVEQRQYAAAVQMYENCLKRFYNNCNTEILQYIARALYKSNKLMDCKKILLRARYLSPSDLAITFNLAKLLKTLARQIFEDRKSTYHAVVTAESELKLARQYFHYYIEHVKKLDKGKSDFIELEYVELEEQDCVDLLLQVEKSIKADAEQRDREENERRREHEHQLRLELARKAEEDERKALEEKQKKEELENKRRELLKRQEEAKQKLLEETGHAHGDDGSDDGSRRKKSKTKKKDKGDRAERERERQERDRIADSKKYKSRAILSSDSSSSSDEGEDEQPTMPAASTGADDDGDDGDDDDDL